MKSWKDNVRRVVPYVPGEQPNDPDMIKLNTNENPYPPSPRVKEAIKNMDTDTFRLYPDPAAYKLVKAIADYHGLNDNQVFVGVGSDDVLAMAFMTFFNSDIPVLFPDITYSFYDVWADLLRIPYCRIPLNQELEIDWEDYCRVNGGIIFPNPNAPTGTALSLGDVRHILDSNRQSAVIVDEAYVDFGAETALPLLDEYDNLLVVRTFSKSRSLAGMRIGYACGNEEMIRCLNDVKYSFNSYTMDMTVLEAGAASIADEDYFRATIAKVTETREWTQQQLRRLGFTLKDSRANFVFASHESCPAKELFESLRQNHIYVRYFDKPRIDNYLRITIGTPEEMKILMDFLERYLTVRKGEQ
ncbi:MAG: histidinol-phosphate transaminase [Ruminococcus sp.]|jgi:histidinol-phosphate aminotransferase